MSATLKRKILRREPGLLFYGLTPPKMRNDSQKIAEIVARQMNRLHPDSLGFGLDGVIVYDIQDESSRTAMPRPFPFTPTLAPELYAGEYLRPLPLPKIVYQSVASHDRASLLAWIAEQNPWVGASVWVGSASKHQAVSMGLQEAYAIKREVGADFPLGGVTIPERHHRKGNEHRRVLEKQKNGCSFFVSQCVYHVDHVKKFLTDYASAADQSQLPCLPMIFTLTPCGSEKTLKFMQWLGIDIPGWLENDLRKSQDILGRSLQACKSIAAEILAYAGEMKIPVGFNIESVAIRKEEIDASLDLLREVRNLQRQSGEPGRASR